MEKSELLKEILHRVGVSEEDFTRAAAEVLTETVDQNLITMIRSVYLLNSSWVTNCA